MSAADTSRRFFQTFSRLPEICAILTLACCVGSVIGAHTFREMEAQSLAESQKMAKLHSNVLLERDGYMVREKVRTAETEQLILKLEATERGTLRLQAAAEINPQPKEKAHCFELGMSMSEVIERLGAPKSVTSALSETAPDIVFFYREGTVSFSNRQDDRLVAYDGAMRLYHCKRMPR